MPGPRISRISPADDMVLEWAVAGGAAAIVTSSIADFPVPALARFGLGGRRPGELLRQLVPFPPRAT
jgi:hypothetical protein